MRYIDIDAIPLPDGWLDSAEAAKDDVVNNDADPENYSQVWRGLKSILADQLNEKCWYCETHIGRSDNAVDHFRPKKRVANTDPPHNGYRWLAFEKSNFRYACTFCNSTRIDHQYGTRGGKQDLFPLATGSMRSYQEADGDPREIEDPILLDPCDIDDWELLGVKQENGNPCPASNDAFDIDRVNTSIEVYHLDIKRTCTERLRIIVGFMANVKLAKDTFILSATDFTARRTFKDARCQIKRATNRDAPFSGEMIYLLKGQRSEQHPWINDLLAA